jgi:exopolyphosphatase / guanosine-5'-triphosphate,3'-diphosphate pyrophosphatase
MSKPRIAAIDIGTNSFHLVIAEVDRDTGKFNILGRQKETVRLGSGSSDMKLLSNEAMYRGFETLKRFKALADSAGAPVRAIATSAVREAENQLDFIYKAKNETGVKIEVASGIEEARFIYLGILQALPVFSKKILLIDIGGGSTEFLIGFKREIIYDNSIKLGAIRMTNRFFNNDKIDNKAVKECRKFIKGTMNPVIRQIKQFDFEVVIGSSGTILNIANIINVSKGNLPDSRLNNFQFTSDELSEAAERILEAKTVKQREKIPGLDTDRADIITGGVLILEQIFKELKIKELTVSEYALREGILMDTIENKFTIKAKDHLEDIRYKSVVHVAENFSYEKEHSMYVAYLALKIFDETYALHKLNRQEREYLEAAAILHEVGCFISHTLHHKHSYYLIRNSELLGFTENEKEIIANVARYHRKSHPKEKHEEYAKLGSEDKEIVKKLASILRIADGLDRAHNSAAEIIECSSDGKELMVKLNPKNSESLELEIWGAETKKGLFEQTYGVNVNFQVEC